MRANVLYEYPVTYVPLRARTPKTEQFSDTIAVDLREIACLDRPNALSARVIDNDDARLTKHYEDRGAGAYNAVRSDALVLHGHDGKLWRDCWHYSRERFHERISLRLRGGVHPNHRADPNFVPLLQDWGSRTGEAEPARGYLHWLDRAVEDKGKSDPVLIRFRGMPTFPGSQAFSLNNAKEVISSGKPEAEEAVRELLRNDFLVSGGRLYERVDPPCYRVRRVSGAVVTSFHRELSQGRFHGAAWFSIDERRQFELFRDSIRGRARIHVSGPDNVIVDQVDRDYVDFDRTHCAMKSLQGIVTDAAGTDFPLLPDASLLAWIEMRTKLGQWDPEEGNPVEMFDAVEAFMATIPNERLTLRTYMKNELIPVMAQRPELDLRPRARPVSDPDLEGLSF